PDGRVGRGPHPLHATRRSRGRVALGGSDHPGLGRPRHRPGALSRRQRRPRRRPPAHRPYRPYVARRGETPMTAHPAIHPTVAEVTRRLAERSSQTRSAYLERIHAAVGRGPSRTSLGCANLAHGFAACGVGDKLALSGDVTPNLAIVSSYNDMLS